MTYKDNVRADGEWHTGRIPTEHIEMIIDYTTDGTDYQYNDNHGVLVRCRDCKHFRKYGDGRACSIVIGELHDDDYCSRGEK